MIEFQSVTDRPELFGQKVTLFEDVDFHLPPGRYALLSHIPEHHRAIIDVLAGVRPPLRGRVRISQPISWPVGRMAMVRGRAKVYALINLIADRYGIDRTNMTELVAMLISRPDYIDEPMQSWPPYVRRELVFALMLAPEFDIYCFETQLPFEDSRFTRLWQALFEERLVGKSLIMSSPRQKQLLDYCTKGLIYDEGRLMIEPDLEQCIERYPVRPERADLGEMITSETPIDDPSIYY